MLAKMIFVFFCSTICTTLLYGQDQFSGAWAGTIKPLVGLDTVQYQFSLQLVQKGDSIIGTSFTRDGEIQAFMELVGSIHNKDYFRFEETHIIEQKTRAGMEWCMKSGHLLYKIEAGKEVLHGLWKGKTSFSNCDQGRIYLERPVLIP